MIIVKSGGTAAGAKAASSHTGTLAGSENTFDAAFKQSGILRARTINELFDYARIFSYQDPPKGPNVAIITNAGGPGIIAADAVERSQLRMAAFSKSTIDKLRSSLPPMANVYNPIDVLGDARADRYKFVIETIADDPHVDIILTILTPQAMTEIEKTAEVIGELTNRNDKTMVASFMGGKRIANAFAILSRGKVPNYIFPESAVLAIDAFYRYALWQKKPVSNMKKIPVQKDKILTIVQRLRQTGSQHLNEEEAKVVLATYGFLIPKSILAASEEDAVRAAEKIGFPVVMKISSPDILHKTDIGGVVIGLKNITEVRRCFHEIIEKARRLMPDADIRGVLIQQMVTKGKEVILGVSRDPQFGPLLMFGLGGIYIEILKDVTFRIAPVGFRDAEEMIREIQSFPLLKGVRGEKSSDLDAIVDNILRLSQLVTDFPEIIEMDINPLMVLPQGEGAIAIDARIAISL